MKILNDTQFDNLIIKLARDEVVIESANELDLMDYHWFLLSILESLKKKSKLELLRDSDGQYEDYKILDAEINDSKLNKLTLKLEREKDNKIVNYDFLIKGCKDARMIDHNFRKYYIDTNNERYRFLIRFLSDN